MRDAHDKLSKANVEVVVVSRDDQEALETYRKAESFPFMMLSDEKSETIEDYGVLNTLITRSDAFFYGIPFPGIFLSDPRGQVIGKFFHDSYKKRDSAENLIDLATGLITLDESAPCVRDTGDDAVQFQVFVHGGNGSIRQGVRRKLVIRATLQEGYHLYDEPVPTGMVAMSIDVIGPPGLVFEDLDKPATEELKLESVSATLNVWSGRVDFVLRFYGVGELVSEVRPLDQQEVILSVNIKYQICDADQCLLPTSNYLKLKVPLEVVEVPNLGIHTGHGQKEGSFDAMPHMKRLIVRSLRDSPLRFLIFVLKTFKNNAKAFFRARQQH